MRKVNVGDTPIKFVPLKSRRFLCGQCLEFCIEITPVISRGMGPMFFKKLREDRNRAILDKTPYNNPLKMKLQCPNGCHKAPWWTFNDIRTPRAPGIKPKVDRK